MIKNVSGENGAMPEPYNFDVGLFADVWKHLNEDADYLPSAMIFAVLEEIEKRIGIEGKFLSDDVVIRSRIQFATERSGIQMGEGSPVVLLQRDVFAIILNALEDVKILEYNTGKIYGNFNDRHSSYQDDMGNLVFKTENNSVSDDSDLDDVDSLMDAGSRQSCMRSSPSLLELEEEREIASLLPTAEKHQSHEHNTSYNIGELIQKIEESHHTIDFKFDAQENQLKKLKAQNESDLLNLNSLIDNNEKVQEKMFDLRLEIQGLFKVLYRIPESHSPHSDSTKLTKKQSSGLEEVDIDNNTLKESADKAISADGTKQLPKSTISMKAVLVIVLILYLLG